MSSNLTRRAHAVFAEALAKPNAEQGRFVEMACDGDQQLRREVELLLRSADQDTADGFLSPLPFNVKHQLERDSQEDPLVGTQLGAYEVRERIGQGGMGNVYLGMRVADYKQPVAIKVIKRGMDTEQILRRFRHEMQFSAALSEHSNIAATLDAGTTDDGLPYFVMEYVDGDRIDRFCDERRLDVRARLELMRQVCSAVQHAHQRTVIHRDLKPSNILVTEQGVPKLIDFGIAKLTDPEADLVSIVATETEQRLLTPEYASPEQVSGGIITTATDVYSLGVILYELLTGRKPYQLTSEQRGEIERVIKEEEPRRPSTVVGLRETLDASDDGTHRSAAEQMSLLRGEPPRRLRRTLHGDLDNIVLMALRKEPQRRYASVEQLSADIQNYLEGLPVQARADTWRYRTGKLVRRHRLAFIAAGLILITLLGGIVASMSQAIRAARQAERAERQAELADAINEFLVDDFIRASDPHFQGDQGMTMYEAVTRAASRLKDSFEEQPETKAAMHRIFSESLLNLGRYEEAVEQSDLALEFYQSFPPGSQHEQDTVTALKIQGDAFDNLGDHDRAEELLDQAYQRGLRYLGEEHPVTLAVMGQLGETLQTAGKYDVAEPLLRHAYELSMRLVAPDQPERYTPLNSLAAMLRAQERYAEAEPLNELYLEMVLRHLGPEHPNSINAMNQIASLYYYQASVADQNGDAEEQTKRLELARPIFKQLVESAAAVLPENHNSIAVYEGNYGVTLAKLGRFTEAEPHVLKAYRVAQASVGDDSENGEWYLRNAVKFYESWVDDDSESASRKEALLISFERHARLLIKLLLLRAEPDADDNSSPKWWLEHLVSKTE